MWPGPIVSWPPSDITAPDCRGRSATTTTGSPPAVARRLSPWRCIYGGRGGGWIDGEGANGSGTEGLLLWCYVWVAIVRIKSIFKSEIVTALNWIFLLTTGKSIGAHVRPLIAVYVDQNICIPRQCFVQIPHLYLCLSVLFVLKSKSAGRRQVCVETAVTKKLCLTVSNDVLPVAETVEHTHTLLTEAPLIREYTLLRNIYFIIFSQCVALVCVCFYVCFVRM